MTARPDCVCRLILFSKSRGDGTLKGVDCRRIPKQRSSDYSIRALPTRPRKVGGCGGSPPTNVSPVSIPLISSVDRGNSAGKDLPGMRRASIRARTCAATSFRNCTWSVMRLGNHGYRTFLPIIAYGKRFTFRSDHLMDRVRTQYRWRARTRLCRTKELVDQSITHRVSYLS